MSPNTFHVRTIKKTMMIGLASTTERAGGVTNVAPTS